MSDKSQNQFGTFGGVFTPSILTILGVIMFMRTGYVTGQAGIWEAVIILLIAKSITFFTGLSISAVSTNTKVKGGGAYFLISRSLGPEFGGAIGLALFLAQAFSVPFYVLGFVEALTVTFPQFEENFLLLGVITSCGLFAMNYVGAGWAIRAQYFILAVLVGSIVSFVIGSILNFSPETFQANASTFYVNDEDFWTIFAVFFPAVTGIMAGVNMSGDLKEPEKSIPKGTLAAIAVGALVYLVQIIVTGGSISRQALISDPYGSLLDQSLFGFTAIVIAGVFAATLSSAIGSLMGAPRILQALARDHIFPVLAPFAMGTEKGDEPRRGLWLTFAMTLAVLWFAGNDAKGGALNAVASLLTMFFLFTYGMTNAAAFIEQFSKNPSFRPRFRYFHWVTALLGGVGCFGAAILINPGAAAAALVIIVLVFFYVSRRVLETTFGDARRGFYYERVRSNLRRLAGHPPHPKNWRPTTLVLTGNPATRLTLTSYASWLESGRGIVTLSQVIVGDVHENIEKQRTGRKNLDDYIESNGLNAYSEIIVSPSFDDGMSSLLQVHSIGPLKPNLVMLGWPNRVERAVPFAKHLRLSKELGMSQIVLIDEGLPPEEGPSRIDVWWRGRENGSLMVILAYLLTSNWEWRRSRIRILRMLMPDEAKDEAEKELLDLIAAARIEADHHLVASDDFPDFKTALHETSGDADCVFLGFQPPSDERAEGFHTAYSELVDGMPTTLIVCSSGEADLMS